MCSAWPAVLPRSEQGGRTSARSLMWARTPLAEHRSYLVRHSAEPAIGFRRPPGRVPHPRPHRAASRVRIAAALLVRSQAPRAPVRRPTLRITRAVGLDRDPALTAFASTSGSGPAPAAQDASPRPQRHHSTAHPPGSIRCGARARLELLDRRNSELVALPLVAAVEDILDSTSGSGEPPPPMPAPRFGLSRGPTRPRRALLARPGRPGPHQFRCGVSTAGRPRRAPRPAGDDHGQHPEASARGARVQGPARQRRRDANPAGSTRARP